MFLRNGTVGVEGADCVNARAAPISAHGVGRIVGLRREAVRVFILYRRARSAAVAEVMRVDVGEAAIEVALPDIGRGLKRVIVDARGLNSQRRGTVIRERLARVDVRRAG